MPTDEVVDHYEEKQVTRLLLALACLLAVGGCYVTSEGWEGCEFKCAQNEGALLKYSAGDCICNNGGRFEND